MACACRRVVLGRLTRQGQEEDDDQDLHAAGSEIERQWFVVDADGETLGRLASTVARCSRASTSPRTPPTSTRAIT